jgi:hypothetical protein
MRRNLIRLKTSPGGSKSNANNWFVWGVDFQNNGRQKLTPAKSVLKVWLFLFLRYSEA